MRFLLSALAALVLAGCAAYATDQANAIRAGDLDTGERLAISAIHGGHELRESWYNLGIVYQRKGQRDRAIQAFTMAARYGSAPAQNMLVSYRVPVPPADLGQSSNTDGIAAAVDGFNRGYGGGMNCTSFGDPDMRFINCR